MRTVIRFGALTLVIATVLGAWWLRSAGAAAPVAIRSNVEVRGSTPEQLAMARWAVGRFEAAELDLPVVEIAFHRGSSGCGGHLGFARDGEVDVCTTLVNAMARRILLHEMSHIWLDKNLSEEARGRFLESRGLRGWNASSDAWAERGYEQAAEIIAWALGERILTAQIPYNEPTQLARGFELLTGSASPRDPASVVSAREP